MKSMYAFVAVGVLVSCALVSGLPVVSRKVRALPGDLKASITEAVKNSTDVESFSVEDLDYALLDWKPPLNISKKFTYYLAGHDAEKRPIWVLEFGRWDLKGIVEKGGQDLENFSKYIRQAATRALKSIREQDSEDFPVNEAVVILDYEGLQLEQLTSIQTVSYGIKLARAYRDLITEHLHSVIIINTSFVAHSVLNIARPIFGHIWDRLEVYGNNKAKWMPALVNKFPKNQLPPWYGGHKDFKPVQVFG